MSNMVIMILIISRYNLIRLLVCQNYTQRRQIACIIRVLRAPDRRIATTHVETMGDE